MTNALLSPASAVRLSNKRMIPVLGFGVYDSPASITTTSCLTAFEAGYRHIDTAEVYGNEAAVGDAVQKSGLARSDLFVTTKVYLPGDTAAATADKLENSIRKSGGPDGYVDLMLIHNATIGPDAQVRLWTEMEKLHNNGRIRSIGVSNHGIRHLEHLRRFATVWPPAVNQIELHPWLQQRSVVEYCQQNGIVVEAYCPLVRNQKANDPDLVSIAKKHVKTTAQVLLRWCLQKEYIPLPKSDNPERIKANANVFGWELDARDMEMLDAQPQEDALVMVVDNEDQNFPVS